MLSLSQIESDLKEAMKAKDAVAVDVLRGLKTRVQNEQIAKIKELSGDEIIALIKSELKKRKEAETAFIQGNRQEMAEKEAAEAKVLEKYLPPQMSEEELLKLIEQVVVENNFTAQDFGKAMGQVKAKVGASADGAVLAKLLKERLK